MKNCRCSKGIIKVDIAALRENRFSDEDQLMEKSQATLFIGMVSLQVRNMMDV